MSCSEILNNFYGKYTALWISKKDIFRNRYSQISNSKAYQEEERFKVSSLHLSKLFQSIYSYLFIGKKIEWVTFTWLGQGIQLVTIGSCILGNICNPCLQEIEETCKVPLNLSTNVIDYLLRGICDIKAFFSFSLYQTQHSMWPPGYLHSIF